MISEHERLDAFRRDQERKPPPKSAREKMDDEVRAIPFALPKPRKRDE